uniref:Uncharacterized protein n=1 Tax=Chromera velia CCMP2878 TaxID=1169474 RepID=A0A0G4HA59_9ALVE
MLRVFLVGLCYVHLVFTAGLVVGWSNLRVLLDETNVYAFKCKEELGGGGEASSGDPITSQCNAAELYTNLMFSVASTMGLVSALPFGMLIDKFGPRFVAVPQAVLTLGFFLVGFAFMDGGAMVEKSLKEFNVDVFFAGFILMIMPGFSLWPSHNHVAHLFPRTQNFVIAVLSAAFPLGALIFAAALVLTRSGVSASLTFFGLAGLQTVFVVFCLLLPSRPFLLRDSCRFSLTLYDNHANARGGPGVVAPETTGRSIGRAGGKRGKASRERRGGRRGTGGGIGFRAVRPEWAFRAVRPEWAGGGGEQVGAVNGNRIEVEENQLDESPTGRDQEGVQVERERRATVGGGGVQGVHGHGHPRLVGSLHVGTDADLVGGEQGGGDGGSGEGEGGQSQNVPVPPGSPPSTGVPISETGEETGGCRGVRLSVWTLVVRVTRKVLKPSYLAPVSAGIFWFFSVFFYLSTAFLQLQDLSQVHRGQKPGERPVHPQAAADATRYSELLGWLFPTGIPGGILFGLISDWKGPGWAMVWMSCLGLVFLLLSSLGAWMPFSGQLGTFVFMTNCNEATGAMFVVVLLHYFGVEDYNALVGFAMLVLSLALLSLNSIAAAILSTPLEVLIPPGVKATRFFWVHITFLSLGVATLIYPSFLISDGARKKSDGSSRRRSPTGGGEVFRQSEGMAIAHSHFLPGAGPVLSQENQIGGRGRRVTA